MADEQSVIKQIVWTEVFSFPHIFKSFKMAIRPSSLLLGMALLALLFVGGYVLDGVWGTMGQNISPDEMQTYLGRPPAEMETLQKAWDEGDGRLDAAITLYVDTTNDLGRKGWITSTDKGRYAANSDMEKSTTGYGAEAFYDIWDDTERKPIDKPKLEDVKKAGDSYSDYLSKAKDAFDDEMDAIDSILDDLEDNARKKIDDKIKGENADEEKDKAREALGKYLDRVQATITQRHLAFARRVRAIEGVGVFESFNAYEQEALHNAILSVRHLNFTGGLSQYMRQRQAQGIQPVDMELNSFVADPRDAQGPIEQPGMICYLLMMADGVRWMICQHYWFAAIFLFWSLAIWSVLGGAIYRIAAIQFARDEKISAGQALKFAKSKALSFFLAPLVPVAVILLVALLLVVGGAIGSLGSIGAIVMGVLFLIAILLGIAAAFLIIGLVAGLPLMFPTIAAEGSDSFDAISRSVSYVFRRPFRAVFYGVIASIYGMVTYLFVRFFAYVALCSTHTFVKWGMFTGGDRLAPNADKMDVLWSAPTFWDLHTFNWAALSGGEKIAALLVGLWVYVLVTAVAAYLITFFASASTTVYFILRRREDGTDLDDVYVEEEPEEYAEPEAPAEPDKADEPKAEEAPAEKAEEAPAEEPKEDADESKSEGEEKSE